MSLAFTGAIAKITGRCNINCSYCYMYNLADTTSLAQPKRMNRDVVIAFFANLKTYMVSRSLSDFHISLHGGEPLLAGTNFVRFFNDQARQLQDDGLDVTVSLQTNALLLDDHWFDLFEELGIHFGVSCDGPAEYHDHYRLDFSGRGTHRKVESVMRRIKARSSLARLFGGALCVIHPRMDGQRLIKYFHELNVSVDLLLPDQNYIHRCSDYPVPGGKHSYGRVLVEAFQTWVAIDTPKFRVRKFSILLSRLLGGRGGLDSLGNSPLTLFTLETNGDYEPLDSLKCCGDGFTKTALNALDNPLEELEGDSTVQLGFLKTDNLPEKCQCCQFMDLCGGGYLPHRFDGNGFARESIYCEDLKLLFAAVDDYLSADLIAGNSAVVNLQPAFLGATND